MRNNLRKMTRVFWLFGSSVLHPNGSFIFFFLFLYLHAQKQWPFLHVYNLRTIFPCGRLLILSLIQWNNLAQDVLYHTLRTERSISIHQNTVFNKIFYNVMCDKFHFFDYSFFEIVFSVLNTTIFYNKLHTSITSFSKFSIPSKPYPWHSTLLK